jgi:dolichyl-phosphate-mannose-protein mannosyltransferase
VDNPGLEPIGESAPVAILADGHSGRFLPSWPAPLRGNPGFAMARFRTAGWCLAIFVLGLASFLVGIEEPREPYFDEIHYLPAIRQMLDPAAPGERLNREHPPLAKELMAVGIAIWGDTPLGWRCMSALFGALALVGFQLWAEALFADRAVALWATATVFLDQMLYVQARIAMLDIFALAFMLWALAGFTASARPGAAARLLLAAAGLCLGLATACKWIGVLPWALCVGLALIAGLSRYRGSRDLWPQMRLRDWLFCLGIMPFAAYVASFFPITGFSPSGFIAAQVEMWHLQGRVPPAHPYMSEWYSWPVLARPIWYLFDRNAEGSYAAVVCLGNPIILWAGLPALLISAIAALRERRRDAAFIVAAFAALYLPWAVIPRTVAFLYYYLPAAMAPSLALAFLFHRTGFRQWPWLRHGFLLLAALGFLYFLPISSAAITVTLPQFENRAWFPSWR